MTLWERDYKHWLEDSNVDKADQLTLKGMTEEEIKNNFYEPLAFGTAGIRGKRGLGTNRINKYIIGQVTQGYADYLLEEVEDARVKGVAIAYDSRHMSREFALEAAKVLSGNGIAVFIFNTIRSTPELSFTVRHLKAAGGIVLTASHNPKEYSGYKAYNPNGCQLSTKETEGLAARIEKIKDFSQIKKDETGRRIKWLTTEIEDIYVERIMEQALTPVNKDLKVVYTPLHGVGLSPIKRIFDLTGVNYFLVDEQCIPDGDFPTAKKPNPEELEALELLVAKGLEVDGDLLLATDPDADRLGVLVKKDGAYIYLTGNQVGGLLIDYILRHTDKDKSKMTILTSIVTSEFGKAVGSHYGASTEITFTGFKNLGYKMDEVLKEGKEICLAYEESIGYLPSEMIRDKDGISASFLLVLMAGELLKEDKTLFDRLQELYKLVGYYEEKQISFSLEGIKGLENIKSIMEDLRLNGPGSFSENLELKSTTDYTEESIDGEHTNLLYYKFTDGSWVGVRPSGTEPKIKLYINVVAKNTEEAVLKIAELEKWFQTRAGKWLNL